MQISNLPKLLPTPFANSGSKQDIPIASQIGIAGGRASYTDGFPPLTRTPIAAGGIPPFGTDFNGVLNDITSAIRWAQAGGGYRYDSEFSSAVGGYPLGSVVSNSTGDGCWLNTIDGNANNPEVSVATPLTGWVPVDTYGSTVVSGLSSSSITLTTVQAAKDRLELSGTLTSNINLILPAWKKPWKIVNNCSGSFTITVKTTAGTGITVPTGIAVDVYGDGTNILANYATGSLINVRTFTSTGTYMPTPGTKSVIVEAVGGGGGGGGCAANAAGSASVGQGGGAGAYGKSRFTSGFSGVSVAIGSAGSPGAAGASGVGGSGGDTSFGSLLICQGGPGGKPGASLTTPSLGQSATPNTSTVTGANIVSCSGQPGTSGFIFASNNNTGMVSGYGGSGPFGSGGAGSSAIGSVNAASGYGAGGGGAISSSAGSAQPGASGSQGVVIIWEYA